MRRWLLGGVIVALHCSPALAWTDCHPEWLGKRMGQIEDMMEDAGQRWHASLTRDPNGGMWLQEHYDGMENGVVISYPFWGDTELSSAMVHSPPREVRMPRCASDAAM
jgi:hypothetical protein